MKQEGYVFGYFKGDNPKNVHIFEATKDENYDPPVKIKKTKSLCGKHETNDKYQLFFTEQNSINLKVSDKSYCGVCLSKLFRDNDDSK